MVDHIFILESRQAFRGNAKPLAYPQVLPRLAGAAINNIHYTVLDTLDGNFTWAKEAYQRNSLLQVALERSGIVPHPKDVLVISGIVPGCSPLSLFGAPVAVATTCVTHCAH